MIINPSSWLEISASAFNHNLSQFKKAIGTGRLLAPVIKGNAYGHGMIEIATLCEANDNVDWLCVVKLSEALALRHNGITKPILILGFIDEDPAKAVGKNIEYPCSDYESACELNTIGQRTNSRINIHLKVDTGLARFGVQPDFVLTLMQKIRNLPFININGIWSHCAESHNQDQSFTHEQINTFKTCITNMAANNIAIPLKHMGNSAATTSHDLSFCNLFRVGLGVYGYWSSESMQKITQHAFPDFTLQPVASWKTRIMCIKKISAGKSIGYDRTAYAQQNTTVALLPIGYDDGYNPFLSNKALIGIDNCYAPIIGRVAMNVTTIDITHIKNAQVGSIVTLIGSDQNYNALTLAQSVQINNPRYITTNIKASIPRIVIE